MYFSIVFSLCLNLVSALLDSSLTCNFYEDIGMNNEHYFTNPNWPSKYKSGDSCRWEFKCHDGFVCRLRCRDVGLPQSDGCHIDNLLVSPSGDLLFRDAKTYCGRKRINVKSTGNRISMGCGNYQIILYAAEETEAYVRLLLTKTTPETLTNLHWLRELSATSNKT